MGSLIVRKYPTKLFLNAADHTYVECATGARGWGCWGGKAGGALLQSTQGSTRRACAVAGPNERAGITCYLINGVCHQAANRILHQSGITVDGARGYSLSVSLFGLLGRGRALLGLCRAPFDDHPAVAGDFQECIGTIVQNAEANGEPALPGAPRHDFEDEHYMAGVHALYKQMDPVAAGDHDSLFKNQLAHFKLFMNHRSGSPETWANPEAYNQVMIARSDFERARLKAEEDFASTKNGMQFVDTFDELTLAFQAHLAQVLDVGSYTTLLGLQPGEPIVLSDPEIVHKAYGDKFNSNEAAT